MKHSLTVGLVVMGLRIWHVAASLLGYRISCHAITVYPPLLPTTVGKLKNRITTAVESIIKDMLAKIWNEFDCRLDVIYVTKGAHIKHF